MAEYIEREALKERLDVSPLFSNIRDGGFFIKDGVLDLVDRYPAADVVEVRHGEWAGDAFCDVLTCKECSYEHALYVLGKLSATNYCPNCGAKMDGKGEGE